MRDPFCLSHGWFGHLEGAHLYTTSGSLRAGARGGGSRPARKNSTRSCISRFCRGNENRPTVEVFFFNEKEGPEGV